MSSTTLNFLIRADAGPRIGIGHVMRQLALAKSLIRMGATVNLICSEVPGVLSRKFSEEKISFHQTSTELDADHQQFNDRIRALRPDWIILDGYRFDDEFQQRLDLQNSKLLVVDDYGHARHERATAVFNQNVYASPEMYPCLASNQLIGGCQFTLLRDEFQEWSQDFEIRKVARRILITFGGSDPDNQTLKVLKLLGTCEAELSADIIIGPCNPHLKKLESDLANLSINVRIHRNVDRMSTLFSQTDLAITAGGSTCYELARCGVPMIIIPIAENQIPIANELARQKAAIQLSPLSADNSDHARQTIGSVLRSRELRRRLSRQASKLVDGSGAARLARRLAAECFRFRPAEIDDMRLTHRWRNDPEIRAICFEESLIPIEKHRDWFRSKLQNSTSRFWIIEDKQDRPVGQIRMEYQNENRAIITTNLVPSVRGRGLGTSFIEKTCREAIAENPELEIVALIKRTNTFSQTAFRKAGFTKTSTLTVNDQVALEFTYPTSSRRSTILRKAS